jgi:chaperonin GroEL
LTHHYSAIGELVADAMGKVGDGGLITVQESKTTGKGVEVVEGMRFSRGFLLPYSITNRRKMEAVMEGTFVLIPDRKIGILRDMVPLLEKIAKAASPILIVEEDAEGEAIAILILNQISGALKSCAVKAPGFGDQRKAIV